MLIEAMQHGVGPFRRDFWGMRGRFVVTRHEQSDFSCWGWRRGCRFHKMAF